MECPACQSKLPDEARFCNVCGERLELECPQCNKVNPLGSRFCLACGKELAEKLPSDTTELVADAERKQVTALFSDLTGYTALTERVDPEEVKEITGRIFQGVTEIVARYDGFIERFAGDGVLAFFGVPKAHEDDPVRAIRAAREIHEMVEAISPEYEAKVGAPLTMHSGINSGLAVTADVDTEKGTHGVTGESINVAARLSSLSPAGDILVGAGTFHQAEGYFSFENLGKKEVKGKTKPITVYKVLAPKEQPVTTHRLSGLRAELTGRRAEMAQLQDAVDRLKRGQGSIIAISGDAGTGKSRLVEEFKATLDLEKIQWREGHAYAYSQNIPYFPIIELMNRAWPIDEGDPPEKVKERIETGVERLLGKKDEYAPYIGSLYALSYPEIEEVSPEFWRSRLFEAMRAIVGSLARRGPTVFCFEDIHWADPSTLELLRYLLSDIRHPAVFISVYRLPFSLFSDQEIRVMGKLHEEIRLRELSPSDVIDMLESLLTTDTIPPELRRFIQDRVEGNPFYLEEFANSLVESGVLSRDNGDWKLARPLTDADVPSTVQGVISARLDRLETEMKRILQEASVIGRAFLYEVLKRITETRDDLDGCLHGLERLDIVRARSLEADLEYFFKHALTQEVVYNGLLKTERREIHERIGLVMEKLFQERLPEFYETLAFHFKQGRSLLKAVAYLMKAGEKGLRRYAVQESHRYYQEAYDLLSDKPDKTSDDTALLIGLLVEWGLVFYYSGDFKTLEKLLTRHEDLAARLDDRALVGMFYCWFGWTLDWRDRHGDGYEILARAVKVAEESGNPRTTGYAYMWYGWTAGELGLYEESIEFLEKALEMSALIPSDHYLHFKSLIGLGHQYFYKGDSKKAFEAAQRLLEYGAEHSNVRSLVGGHVISAFGHLVDGSFPAALDSCHAALRIAQDPLYFEYARLVESMSYLLNRQFVQAESSAEKVIAFSNVFGTEWIRSLCAAVRGVCSIVNGRMDQGLDELLQTRNAHREGKRRYWHALLEHILGGVYLQIVQGEGDLSLSVILKNIGFLIKNVPFAANKAKRHFKKAIEVAEEIGAKGIAGQAYLDLGRLHKAKKRKDKARECVSKAIEYFELCEAETFLKQAREELEYLG